MFTTRFRTVRLTLTAAAIEIALGLGIYAFPQGFRTPVYAPLRPFFPYLSVTLMAGGVALLLLTRYPQPQWVRRALSPLPAAPVAVLAYQLGSVGVWSAMSLYGLLALSLLAAPWVFAGTHEPEGREQDSRPGMERMMEAWSWLLAVAVVALTIPVGEHPIVPPVTAYIFVLTLCLYNAVMHWGQRAGDPARRLFGHLAFLTASVGLLLTGDRVHDHVFMVVLAATPLLATRALGLTSGRKMALWSLSAFALGRLMAWVLDGSQIAAVLGETTIEALVLAVAAELGIRTAAGQHRLVQDLENARLNLQRQVDKLTLVDEIGGAIRRSLDLDEILRTTVFALGPALAVSRCFIRLQRENTLFPVVYEYTAPGASPRTVQHSARPSVLARVAQIHRVVAVSDVVADPCLDQFAPGWRDDLTAVGARAVLIAPIMAGGDLLGVIGFHQCDGPRAWTESEVEFLEAVAGQVGVAMSHARAHLALVEQSEALGEQRNRLESALKSATLAEEALRTSETKFAGIISLAPDAIISVDDSHRITLFNQAAEQIFGYTAQEILGQPLDLLLPEQFAANHRRHLPEFSASPVPNRGMGQRSGIAGRRKNGEIFPAEASISRLQVNGTTVFTAMLRDVTERNRVEEALRESEERFRTAFETALTGMAWIGLNGRWLQVNPSLCQMLGYSEQELLATSYRSVLHPDDWDTTRRHVRQVLAGKLHSYQVEKRYRHKLGHDVWALVSVSVVRGRDGKPLYFVAQMQDITERKHSEEQLVYLATHDPLTGLVNRRRFVEELERELAQSQRYGSHGAVMFLDLDGFKYVNDSLGHQAGDELLTSLAGELRRRLRTTDIIARLGGDEFAVLLPQTGQEQAQVVAQDIVESLRHHTTAVGGQPISITTSLGVALFPEHGTTAEDLLARADLAMYQAKENGRNGAYTYVLERADRALITSKLTWENRIRLALEKDLFVLHSQPILNLHTDKIGQYELLLRMVGEDGGLIAPNAFLDVAERFGLIHAIDRWVVHQAIRLIAEHERAGRELCLEVNLSGKALTNDELLPMIQHELAETRINPAHLVLEITETAAISDINRACKFIETLRGLGCRFAIDDFGAGFSSFFYLKHLPVDYLKIDGGFIANLRHSPVDQQLVQAMVAVARGLGKQTVAEFVGDEETVRLLREYGVDYVQGYYIGRPGPLPDLLRGGVRRRARALRTKSP